MLDYFQLTLFPPGALQSSVITTVWVGVCVIIFLNARYGTTLAGLVVPGYLVPLFFIKPISAVVVLVEAYLTYGLAYLFANRLLVKSGYSEMFGRDRFFALILLSVLVRIVMDFFILPLGVEHFGAYLGDIDLKNNLQSFGLIIVALIANQMWMGGTLKGTKALFIYLGLTFAIIYWLLIPFTNFNIGGLNYMYEDLATSLLSSPKAYIILLTTAFIASRMNLQFGWEFNGILIPALLALQWYQPEKLVFTFIEAAMILFLGTMAMRAPILKGITFEGGRLLLLFFNIGFFYKILLGFALIELFPALKISDYYGFGYVVSTLIAVKVYQKRIAVKMAISTLFTSLVGIVIATMIGFSLTFLSSNEEVRQSYFTHHDAIELTASSVTEIFNEVRPVSYYSTVKPKSMEPEEQVVLVDLLRKLNSLTVANAKHELSQLHNELRQLDLDIWLTQSGTIILHKLGIGFYVLRMEAESPLVLEVTRARAELGSATLALAMFQKTKARALFIDLSYQLQSTGEYLLDSGFEQGYFNTFHRQFAQHNVLQIRGDLKVTEERKRLRSASDLSPNKLQIFRAIPEGLPLELLRSVVSDLQFEWRVAPINQQWQHDAFGIAELALNNLEMRSALARMEVYKAQDRQDSIENLEGYLISWLIERKKSIARKGSEAFVVPTENELLFWHQDILIPLMGWLVQFDKLGWTDEVSNELQRLNLQANSVGFEFRTLTRPISGQQYLILEEQYPEETGQLVKKNWATLVINLQPKNNYLVQVPNPFFEKTSFEFGAVLFKQLQNRFLLLAGSHPWANQDGSSNVTLFGNSQTLYHVIFMALTKEFEKQQLLPIQVRGFSYQESRPFPEEHALVSLWQNINHLDTGASIDSLLEVFNRVGIRYRFVDGDMVSSPYYVSTNQQIDYLNYLQMDDFVTVWISPLARDSFKASDEVKVEEQHARMLGLSIARQDIRSIGMSHQQVRLDKGVRSALLNYALSRNVHQLDIAKRDLANQHPSGFKMSYLLDSSSLQQFIIIQDQQGRLLGAINLNSLNQTEIEYVTDESLSEYIEYRHRWLLPHEGDGN